MQIHKVELVVLYKRSARDPEGETIARELMKMGINAVKSVRVGKIFVFEVEAESREDAITIVRDLAEKVRLFNPIVHEAWVNTSCLE
ncbi:MAG TPA: phosphoribosylformylglycinamidine synthase subunit PurS [Pyrodictiaceae archaeon]|nr:phosphoribosylformylglycinamidine synthase subunit PurS [Pyrodictiaceae archaeon]